MCGVNGSRLPGFCLQMSFFPSGIVGFQRSHPAIRASIFSPWAARAPNDKFGSRKENAVSPINRTFLKRPKKFPDARHSGEIQNGGLQKGQGFTQICMERNCLSLRIPFKRRRVEGVRLLRRSRLARARPALCSPQRRARPEGERNVSAANRKGLRQRQAQGEAAERPAGAVTGERAPGGYDTQTSKLPSPE